MVTLVKFELPTSSFNPSWLTPHRVSVVFHVHPVGKHAPPQNLIKPQLAAFSRYFCHIACMDTGFGPSFAWGYARDFITFVWFIQLYYALVGWSDPMHCQALLNDGSWLGPNRENWQPNGLCNFASVTRVHILMGPTDSLFRLHAPSVHGERGRFLPWN